MYIVYSKDDCPWCSKAKTLLSNLGYEYQEKKLNIDFSKDDLKAILGENVKLTLPQVYHDDKYIGGFEDLVKHFGF